MDAAILDTDILSEVVKRRNPHVLATARQYLAEHQRLAFSTITVYEIVRGLRANRADRQLAEFLRTIGTSELLDVTMPVLTRAAELWSEGRNLGHPHDDADLMIAATALESNRVLVTGNTSHFAWITGLRLANWRAARA